VSKFPLVFLIYTANYVNVKPVSGVNMNIEWFWQAKEVAGKTQGCSLNI
jgi:glycine/serine hydroxymethyltransferase